MINPTIVEGQIHGGVAQGIGDALLQELFYDEYGQLLTASFMDYAVPSAVEVPEIEVGHIETPSPFTTGGSKGMGEGGAIPPGAVLASAVEDALRGLGPCAVTTLPLSPERVMWLADQARER
jgi:carbon-monoxide dehydrogenase large subunit